MERSLPVSCYGFWSYHIKLELAINNRSHVADSHLFWSSHIHALPAQPRKDYQRKEGFSMLDPLLPFSYWNRHICLANQNKHGVRIVYDQFKVRYALCDTSTGKVAFANFFCPGGLYPPWFSPANLAILSKTDIMVHKRQIQLCYWIHVSLLVIYVIFHHWLFLTMSAMFVLGIQLNTTVVVTPKW